jgi:hypothetical protein
MKDEEMGRACGTYEGKRIHVFGRKTWRTETPAKKVDGSIILKWILKGWDCRQD